MTRSIEVTAQKWEGGWDLILDDTHATSVRKLHNAQQQIRDYLDTVEPDVDHSTVAVTITYDIGDLGERITATRHESQAAAAAQEAAAKHTRELVKLIVHDRGFTMDDAAALLGVTKARISQLAR